jgi:protease-4
MNPNLFNAVFFQPWNIEGRAWASMAMSLKDGAQNLSFEDFLTPRDEMEIDSNGIAHISITGVLGFATKGEEKVYGDSAYSSIASEIAEAKEQARGIMYHADSPGGAAVGCVELGKVAATTGLPTAAIVQGMGCSAGYALIVGADRIAASPSSIVGSIGTIMPMLDMSGLWEKMGVKPDYVQSGDLKAAGYAPSQTPEERAALQQEVDDLGAQFREHVLTYRSIPADAMRGQAFVAQRGRMMNLVDDATGDYSALYADLVKRTARRNR